MNSRPATWRSVLYRHGAALLTGLLLMHDAAAVSAARLAAILKLPEGFRLNLFATGIRGARSMALGSRGTVFVGSRRPGLVYALTDADRDGVSERVRIIARDLPMPNGVAFRNGDLYVATVTRILRYRNIEQRLDDPPAPEVVYDRLPGAWHHGWRYIRFGPDGWLYIAVGAPCNVCNKAGFARILRLDVSTGRTETQARGVRNSVGFDWDPQTGRLWFTDNGRDHLGDDSPADEINRLDRPGEHFGFPFCHGGDVIDPKFGSPGICRRYKPPVLRLGAHVAPLGLRFYTGRRFPRRYRRGFFVAEHGSWNRSTKTGYRVIFVALENGRPQAPQPFVSGWLQGRKTLGRPVDFLNMPDGSLLISDDHAGLIYRVRALR